MSSRRDDESYKSSVSAGLSADNAAESKPISSSNNSARSKQSSRSNNGQGRGPPPSRDSDAQSYRSKNGNGDNYQDDNQSRRSGRSQPSQRSRRSVDPSVAGSVPGSRGGVSSRWEGGDIDAPPPPRSVMSRKSSSGSSRSGRGGGSRGGGRGHTEPDGMTQGFGADDPDGQQYAPGIENHDSRPLPIMDGNSSPPSVQGSRQSSRQGGSTLYGASTLPSSYRGNDDKSYYSEQSKQSQASRGSYYPEEEDSVREDDTYYSKQSRKSRSTAQTKGGDRANRQLAKYKDDDESYANESRSSSYVSGKSKKAPPIVTKEPANDKRDMVWYNFSRCVTFAVPDACIRKDDAEAKQAWREKVAICFIVFLASAFFVGIFGFIPVMLCRERTVYTLGDVQARTNEDWVAIKGQVYDIGELIERNGQVPWVQQMEAFMHDDASRMFPRTPPALLPDMCLNTAKFADNEALQSTEKVCSDFNDEDKKNGLTCNTYITGVDEMNKYMGEFETGVLAHDGSVLLDSPFTFWVSIHDRVYNVTEYVNDIRNDQTKQIVKDHPMAYLEPTLNNLVINKLNEDATELFLSVYPNDQVLQCMDELFYVGIIDTRFDVVCFVLNIIMYFLLCFVALIMICQMVCSLMYIAKGTRTYTDDDTQDQVIVMVPCYNEGGEELIKTIDSVLGTTYPEENKVIFLIADGVVTGSGEELSTPEHLAEILGFEMDPQNDEKYGYQAIGLLTSNMARVYHGYYEVEDKSLKYLVIVKHGLPMEQTGSAKPGNRGKRDSQLIVMGYFNRIYHGRELTELDAAIEDGLIDLNMQSDDMRLLMTIDADTRVDEMSVTHMTYSMNQNDQILALCGETKVDNKWQSWVTMMQVFEYYNNHHMKKAFESAFGCVTCLPGCFTMYRILNDDGKPLLADDHVYAEYLRNDIDSLHEQNLFHLGEDRMLTTLLLHFFPGMFLSYVPEAQCFTIVPHSMRILLSQRRRWINSTYHNLLELTKVKTMCGVCCCSMKTVVWLDLIACMILPASTVYAVYLIFLVAAGYTQFSILLLVLYGMIIGVQIVVFIVRSRYDFLFWFFYFTIVGVPVFYFILPLYAFWHMDDFSWGETRKVAAMTKTFANPPPQEEIAKDDGYDSTSSSDSGDGSYDRRSSSSSSRRR